MPVAEFTAQCAALAIYGASPTQLGVTFAEGFRHGHLQICLGMTCEYIDAHQAYLHVPEHLENEPVLIYRTDRMSPSSLQAVKMRFLDPSSPVGHLWVMAISHAVCSQVIPKWPWTHPIQNGRYSTHLVPFNELDYAPSFLLGGFSPWSWTNRYSLAPAKPFWFSGKFRDMPSWSTTVQGYDIKIFVPSPALFPAYQYANVLCCIDGQCHYPDIEQWLLKAGDTRSDVLLVHYQDLNPFRIHHISMTAVRRDDEVGDKIIAVSPDGNHTSTTPDASSAISSALDSTLNSTLDSALDFALDSALDFALDSAVNSAVNSSVNSTLDSILDSDCDCDQTSPNAHPK
ncbi:hypothetical protein FRC05_006756 [Tulasnella sp. 425]|nr:hypothetical protein FRC05_006756 [Tulasnella sp. 425]